MATCLLGLGSNVGDRAATLTAAIAQIDALPDVQVARRSGHHTFPAIGGPTEQGDFLNMAAVIETKVPPLALLAELQRVETFHGRLRGERWAERTLDIDLLLYGNDVADTEMLTLPHPRMSFRRFALEPSIEIARKMLHPIIGWPLERLLLHLNAARDQVAVLSPDEGMRREIGESLAKRFGARAIDHPSFGTAEHLWPASYASWLQVPSRTKVGGTPQASVSLPYAAAAFPKLSVLVDSESNTNTMARSEWPTILRQPGRGPTLRIRSADRKLVESEIFAAIEAVWSDLGPA